MSATERLNGSAPTSADALRADIAARRAQLGETVEALAMKTDVKARTKDALRHSIADAKGRGREALSRGQHALGRGHGSADDHQRAISGKVAETTQRPGAIWAGAGIGAAIAGGLAVIAWLRSTGRPVPRPRVTIVSLHTRSLPPRSRATSAWERARAAAAWDRAMVRLRR